MTQEDKELLLVDLCARLPYGVKIKLGDYDYQVCGYNSEKEMPVKIWYYYDSNLTLKSYIDVYLTDYRPYLRPLSSMIEEEKEELQKVTDDTFYTRSYYIGNSKPYTDGEWHTSHNKFVTNIACNKLISWLDKNHFDHRTDDEGKTLIEKGLAIVTPEGMY